MADTPGSQYATHLAFDVSVTPQAATAVRFVFGGALVQTGITAGEQTAFGRASVANGAQGVAVSGIAPVAPGSVCVHDGARDMPVLLHLTQTAGADARNVPFVFGGAQLVTGAGAGDGHGFGVPAVTQPLSVQPAGIAPPGIAAPVLADAGRKPGVLLALTQDAGAQDGRSVRFDFGDAARPVVVPGMAAGAVGEPVLSQPLGARAAGFDALRVGAPFVFAPQVRDGYVDFAFGVPLDDAPQAVRFDFDEEFGIGAGGLDAQEFGAHVLENAAAGLRPAGLDAQAFGTPALRLDAVIQAAGIAPADFGQAQVQNRTQVVRAGGVQTLDGFGRGNVQNRSRFVQVGGWASELYGTTWVSHFLRTITTRGATLDAAGRPRVEHREKRIAPEGIFLDAVGFPVASWTQTIAPQGWDSAQWLTRIIPESETVYPQGMDATLWGETVVRNRVQVVQVPSVRAPGQEELFYGRAHVYNLRQYIVQVYDPNDGLNPPEIGGWMRVENRDRRIGAFGFTGQAFGYQTVDNTARVLTVAGMAAPPFDGAALVAFAVREIAPESIEPPYISHWARVHNGARVLGVAGVDMQAFGAHKAANTRRYFPYITAGEQQIFGTPFVAARVRSIQMESRYSIAPPIVPLPTVDWYTRHVQAAGFDAGTVATRAELRIRWNRIRPQWTHRDSFGDATVRNVTPQIYPRGGCWEEFGLGAQVELFTRYLSPEGEAASRYGRAWVSDKRRRVSVAGLLAGTVSTRAKVERRGTAPYALQHIWLDSPTGGASGYGIAPPGGTQANVQVPPPVLNVREIRTIQNEPSTRFGTPAVAANSIRVEPGVNEDLFGTAWVSAKIRSVTVSEWREVFEPPKPRLSPHTIYAVMEAPAQAIRNHPTPRNLHYVQGWVGFGNARVTLQHRRISIYGFQATGYGAHQVGNATQYVLPQGLRAHKFGIPTLPGLQRLRVFDAPDCLAFGRPSVRRHVTGAQTVTGRGWTATEITRGHNVENFHRALSVRGFAAQQLGASRQGDSRYMRQSLHVGFPDNPPMQGFDAARYGQAWVSYYRRDVFVPGVDTFACEYDLQAFDKRMRVTRTAAKPAVQHVTASGWDALAFAPLMDVRAGTYHIRPDGNAETYRKGAPEL